MAVQKFNNNMFQFEDFDMSGIMNPELVDVMEMRKEANLARGNATDQYEADVADFKNIQATEAEQGIASLPTAPNIKLPTAPNIDYTNFNPTLFEQPFITPDLNFEDIDFTNLPEVPVIPNIPTFVDNPYTEVFDTPTPDPDPVVNLPDLGVYDFDINDFIDLEGEQPFDPGMGDVIDVDIPVSDSPLPDYPFVDPETGGDLVLVPGDPNNPVIVRDPETGDLPDGYIPGGGDGPPGTIPPEVYVPRPPPPPPPAPRSYETVIPYERPLDNVMAGYTRPMDPSLFGSTPGFENSPFRQQPTGMRGGGPLSNSMLNSGLSRLPLNQQNDTLTQVFQSGFRPRR